MTETNAERLEKIENNYKYNHGNTEWEVVAIERNDLTWLIYQAGHSEKLSKKAVELNVFLQGCMEPKDLGRNVADVAMDMIRGQAEQEQELEDALLQCVDYGVEIRKVNKRLREAISQSLEKHRWNNEESARILEKALEQSK